MSTMLESLQLERGQSVTEPVPLWIGGKPRPSVNGDIRADTSPSTGDLLADVHYAGAADIDEAVLAAKVAQPIWARMSITERAARLIELSRRVLARASAFGMLDARDSGTPFKSMKAGAEKGANFLNLIAGVAPELHGRTIPLPPVGSTTRHRSPGASSG